MIRFDFNGGWVCNGKSVSVPHDAMLEAGRKADAPGGSAVGFFVGGRYTYEKTFQLPTEWSGKNVKLQFEGVYKNANVSVNGKYLGGAPYGYIPCIIE